ncbi:hypothetical protein PUN28_015629 [Cardiocondyla obscurior]|uniref:Uncharacterized protein n=1 Tax=Cardiocondyla obscurior TaxID=286306 RepID=A0AAW2EWD4_9HYME
MHEKAQMLIVKKKRRVCIPKTLNVNRCWNIIGPIVAQEIGVSDYTPIPYCFDASAYKIGYIFVPISAQIKCCRSVPVLKILGPIRNFVARSETDPEWVDKEFRSVRTPGDEINFRSSKFYECFLTLQIIVGREKNQISFTGRDYHYLSKPDDMQARENLVINRSAREELLNTEWIGLITNVVVTRIFELYIIKHTRERILYVGDKEHTILFKYEICKLDSHGTVKRSETKKMHCKWLPIGDKESNSLPLTEF